jgi:hypothetical protein
MAVPAAQTDGDWSTGFADKPVFCAVTKSGGSLRIRLVAVQRPRCRFTVVGGERSTEIAYSVHSATQATCWGARERSRMRVDTFR